MKRRILSSLLLIPLVVSLANSGCGAPPEPTPTPPVVGSGLPEAVKVDQLTNTSSDNYANNRWGLIDAATLQTYATSWDVVDSAPEGAPPNGRPAHLAKDARLVVLQINAAKRAAGENYVPSNPAKNVHVYEIDAFRFNETRDTGLISNSVRYQASGPTTDAWLARYGIDLRKDFVVFATGENTGKNGAFFQELARGVYWLSYWGTPLRQLAIVNGTLGKNYTGPLVTGKVAEGTYSNNGFSVKSLRVDHTGLTLPLEDFLAIVDQKLTAKDVVYGFDKQFIIDARPTAHFNRTSADASFGDTHPGQFITTGWNSVGSPSKDDTGRAKTYVPVEGHVKGAVSFPWANLLKDVGDNNWQYKTKAELTALFEAAGYAPSDKTSKVVVSQCRTNFEVQVNGFAARVILGYPTVHFDGSLVEYLSLVSNHPKADVNLKPSDPAYKFRTDIPSRVQHFTKGTNPEAPLTTADDSGVPAYNISNGTGAGDRKVAQAIVNVNATTTRKALTEDREFKREASK